MDILWSVVGRGGPASRSWMQGGLGTRVGRGDLSLTQLFYIFLRWIFTLKSNYLRNNFQEPHFPRWVEVFIHVNRGIYVGRSQVLLQPSTILKRMGETGRGGGRWGMRIYRYVIYRVWTKAKKRDSRENQQPGHKNFRSHGCLDSRGCVRANLKVWDRTWWTYLRVHCGTSPEKGASRDLQRGKLTPCWRQ